MRNRNDLHNQTSLNVRGWWFSIFLVFLLEELKVVDGARMVKRYMIWVRLGKVGRFVSESLPRPISGADSSDPLP